MLDFAERYSNFYAVTLFNCFICVSQEYLIYLGYELFRLLNTTITVFLQSRESGPADV